MLRKLNLLAALVFIAFSLFSQNDPENPVTWKFSVNKLEGGKAELVFTASIEEEWHMYSQFFESGGPMPMEFEWNKSDRYQRIGKVQEITEPVKEFDEVFKINVKYWKKRAVLKQLIDISGSEPLTISGNIFYQMCKEYCIPDEVNFTFNMEGVSLATDDSDNPPEDSGEENTAEAPAEKTVPDTTGVDTTGTAESRPARTKDTSDASSAEQPVSTDNDPLNKKPEGLWSLLILAFGAGLLAAVTPCVFPMIPMTVNFFINSAQKKKGKAFGLTAVYSLSIIVLYTLVGVIAAVFKNDEFTNIISTHWIPNLLFFLLFILFALSFFGAFEITLPSSWGNKTDKMADRGGAIGAFFMALTLVIVSFSCTGPILGGLLVSALQGEGIRPVLGMFVFGLAFSLPFTLLAIFPSWLKNMPKSGGWLNAVKVVLAFVILAFSFYFLSKINMVYHLNLFSREVYLAIWIVISILTGLYLLGKIKMPHDSELKHVSIFRLILAVIVFVFALYLLPGIFGARLPSVSGVIPPLSTQSFDLGSIKTDSGTPDDNGSNTVCEKPLYSDFLELPYGINAYFDYEQGLACAKQLNKPVFIAFTGHGCAKCHEIEGAVWQDERILRSLKEDFVVIALFTDDRTELSEDQWRKSFLDGDIKKTLGAVNRDIEKTKINSIASPYYVIMDAEENILVQPWSVVLNAEKYFGYMKEGLLNFRKPDLQ